MQNIVNIKRDKNRQMFIGFNLLFKLFNNKFLTHILYIIHDIISVINKTDINN